MKFHWVKCTYLGMLRSKIVIDQPFFDVRWNLKDNPEQLDFYLKNLLLGVIHLISAHIKMTII